MQIVLKKKIPPNPPFNLYCKYIVQYICNLLPVSNKNNMSHWTIFDIANKLDNIFAI